MSKILFVGLDVHADTIAVAVAKQGGEVRSHGIIPNRWGSVRQLIHKLGKAQNLRACYEAGPTGDEWRKRRPVRLPGRACEERQS